MPGMEEAEEWEELALAGKAGDREARNRLYFRCERLLRSTCSRAQRTAEGFARGAGPISGEDVAQQTFIIFCDILEGWEPREGRFKELLLKRAARDAQRYVRQSLGYRTRHRVIRLSGPGAKAGWGSEPESEDAVRQIEEAEDRATLQASTDEMHDRWKRLVTMKFADDLTATEISVIEGQSRRTINRDLRAAVDSVRAKMEEWWEDCS